MGPLFMKKRLFLKTLSYAIMHIMVATAVAYALIGDIIVALSIGIIEPIVQTVAFSIHEWVWEHRNKGKPKSAKERRKRQKPLLIRLFKGQ